MRENAAAMEKLTAAKSLQAPQGMTAIDDLKGFRLRLISSPLKVNVWKAVGAVPRGLIQESRKPDDYLTPTLFDRCATKVSPTSRMRS